MTRGGHDESCFLTDWFPGWLVSLMSRYPGTYTDPHTGGQDMTKRNAAAADYHDAEDGQEEMHCIKCGTFLGQYGPGSNGTIPCPKCKEPNMINYSGGSLTVMRRKR